MLVDWSRIEALVDPNDPADEQWMKEMVTTLNENMETRIKNVSTFKMQNEMENLRSELHQIKGVAANFGLTDLFELVQKAEALIKEGQGDLTLPLTEKVEPIWRETQKEIKTRYP